MAKQTKLCPERLRGYFLSGTAGKTFGTLPLGVFDIIHHHHGDLKGQGVLKGADVQAEFFLQLLETVHQCIPVHIKLP